jgi:hypothetical protein
MKLKFKEPYAGSDEAYRQGHEYNFVDTRQASRFIDAGIAMPVEEVPEPDAEPEPAKAVKLPKGKLKHAMDTKPAHSR